MNPAKSCANPPAGSPGEHSTSLNPDAGSASMNLKLFLGLAAVLVLAGCGVQTKEAAPAPSQPPKPSSAVTEMISIPAGEFTMGADDGAVDAKPAHRVK